MRWTSTKSMHKARPPAMGFHSKNATKSEVHELGGGKLVRKQKLLLQKCLGWVIAPLFELLYKMRLVGKIKIRNDFEHIACFRQSAFNSVYPNDSEVFTRC